MDPSLGSRVSALGSGLSASFFGAAAAGQRLDPLDLFARLLIYNLCIIYVTHKHKILCICAKIGKSWSVEVSVERLQELRRRRVMSISDLSEVSGVHRNTIHRIEQGKPAYTTTIRKLARALDVDPAELVGVDRREG